MPQSVGHKYLLRQCTAECYGDLTSFVAGERLIGANEGNWRHYSGYKPVGLSLMLTEPRLAGNGVSECVRRELNAWIMGNLEPVS